MNAEPPPLYCLFRAGDLGITCYRAVQNDPPRPQDFLSFADLGTRFDWWLAHRAVGVSFWEDIETTAAFAQRRGHPFVAELDLARLDHRTPWARTGAQGHVTIWAPAALLLQGVVRLIGS